MTDYTGPVSLRDQNITTGIAQLVELIADVRSPEKMEQWLQLQLKTAYNSGWEACAKMLEQPELAELDKQEEFDKGYHEAIAEFVAELNAVVLDGDRSADLKEWASARVYELNKKLQG